MSLTRASAVEMVIDQGSRRGSDASIHSRKLSFNPIPQDWDDIRSIGSRPGSPAHREPVSDTIPETVDETWLPIPAATEGGALVGAFEVPAWKRIRMLPPPLFFFPFFFLAAGK